MPRSSSSFKQTVLQVPPFSEHVLRIVVVVLVDEVLVPEHEPKQQYLEES
jgi:hypothetical protein